MAEGISKEDSIRIQLGTSISSHDPSLKENPILIPFFEKRLELSEKELTDIIYFSIKLGIFLEANMVNLLDDFQKGCHLIIEILNRISAERGNITILVPGDSGSKISKYIQATGLCPRCNFLEFPFSSEIFHPAIQQNANVKEYWKQLDILIPNIDLTNIIFLDVIYQGNSLHHIKEFIFQQKIDKKLISSANQKIKIDIHNELLMNRDIGKYILQVPGYKLVDLVDQSVGYIREKIANIKTLLDSSSVDPTHRRIIHKILDDELGIKESAPNKDAIIAKLDYLRNNRTVPVRNIINIQPYFNDSFGNLINAEEYNSRCNAKIVPARLYAKPQQFFDSFNCDLFIYIALLFRRYKDQIDVIIRKPKCKCCGLLENLKLCAGCNKVYYCNEKCQTADWKSHKKVCKLLSGQTASSAAASSAAPSGKGASGAAPSGKGGYYEKYMKYKQKYLQLKALIY